VEITGKPIKYMGTSEKLDGLEPFHPERMATRILGMGDVLTLVERAQQAIDMEEAKALEEKMRKQSFSLEDFVKIQKQLKMLGSLDQILGMLPIPGLNKEMREMIAHGGEKQMKRVEVIIQSMTPTERRQPEMINESRKKRIARGCGIPEKDIAQFLKQFEQMRMLMKQLTRMTDDVKKSEEPAPGLHMPRNFKHKNKKPKNPLGNLPPMPPGGFPAGFPGKFPGGGKFPF
jgi:signal recognition particle subunit SRP54